MVWRNNKHRLLSDIFSSSLDFSAWSNLGLSSWFENEIMFQSETGWGVKPSRKKQSRNKSKSFPPLRLRDGSFRTQHMAHFSFLPMKYQSQPKNKTSNQTLKPMIWFKLDPLIQHLLRVCSRFNSEGVKQCAFYPHSSSKCIHTLRKTSRFLGDTCVNHCSEQTCFLRNWIQPVCPFFVFVF